MPTLGQFEDLDLDIELERSEFIHSVLVQTQAALLEPQNRDALRFLGDLDPTHERDGYVDRLLVAVFPDFLPDLLNHYEKSGPRLMDISGADTIHRLDLALATLVPVLAGVYAALVARADRSQVRRAAELGAYLSEIAAHVRGARE